MILKWEDPPPAHGPLRPHDAWKPTAAELRTRPGEWALIAEFPNPRAASTFAWRVREGKTKVFAPAGTYEARPRNGKVWSRYVGEPGRDMNMNISQDLT